MYMLFCVVALVGASCTNSGWLMTRHCCFTVLGESYSAHSIAQQPRREVFVLVLLPETNGVSLEAENKVCFRLLMLLLYFRLATLVGIIIPFTVHVPIYRRKDVFDERPKLFGNDKVSFNHHRSRHFMSDAMAMHTSPICRYWWQGAGGKKQSSNCRQWGAAHCGLQCKWLFHAVISGSSMRFLWRSG